jgi:putative hydroxymethylpyrimidine transport system substrate-binding protein
VRRTLILFLAASILGACGSGSASRSLPTATLVLDFTPNAVHAGIYAALARGYDRRAGVHLHVIAPTASTDSIKLLETGRAAFAILDIHDLAIARQRGQDVVGIMAIVERPLAAVIAQPQIHRPSQLEGRLVGITGVPSDTAVLDSIVAGARGDPHRLHTITIGFNAVPDLLAGRVSAATAFWNDEGVAVRRARPGFHVFRVDEYGAPPYPELVLCATAASLRHDPSLARGVVGTLVRGYRFAIDHPAAAAAELESQVPGLNPGLVSAELAGLEPAFRGPGGAVGELDPGVLRRWARWEARFAIVSHPPDVGASFDPAFLPSSRMG